MSALTRAPRAEAAKDAAPAVDNRRALDRIWLLVALALPFAIGNSGRVNQIDFWWSISVGREIVTTGRFPSVEPLFFTPVVEDFPWAQWLAHVLLYIAHAIGGFPGVILLHGLIALTVAALLFVGCRRAGARTPLAAGLTVIGSVFASVGMAERPQLFAIVPFAAFALLLTSRRVSQTMLVGLPLLMVYWVNVHGSFVLGLGLVGLCWLDRVWLATRAGGTDAPAGQLRPLAILRGLPGRLFRDGETRRRTLLVGLVALATLVGPLGYQSWAYAIAMQGNAVIRASALEWQPTSVGEAYGVLVFAGLAGIALLACWRRSVPEFGQLLAFAVFTVLALLAIRNGVWWAIVAMPFAARLASWGSDDSTILWTEVQEHMTRAEALPTPGLQAAPPAPGLQSRECAQTHASDHAHGTASGASFGRSTEKARRSARRLSRLNWLLSALIVLIAVLTTPHLRPLQPSAVRPGVGAWLAIETPTGVGEFLRASDLSGNVFADANWTAYLVEATRGRPARFFADCRFELHPAETWDEYGRVLRGHASWQEALDRHEVTWLVLDVERAKELLPLVRANDEWREVYTDERGAVFRRKAG